MLDSSRINFSVNGTQLIADSINISQELSNTPNYVIGNQFPIDRTSRTLNTKIAVSYYTDIYSPIVQEPNYVLINNWKNDPTTELNVNLNIGGVNMTGYLDNYAFDIIPNQPIKVQASYIVFQEINDNIANQSWINLSTGYSANTKGHGWTIFLFNNSSTYRIENPTGNLIDLRYNFNATILPKYKIGSPFPSQIISIDANENIQITHESQFNTKFSGQSLESMPFSIDSFALKPLYSDFSPYTDYSMSFDLRGFISESTKTDIKLQDSIFFQNTFKKFY